MPLTWFDHVNIRTANLAALDRFYTEVLGLKLGPRPPFDIGGSWIYIGDQACVHLVDMAEQPAGTDPRIEHFAFMAKGLSDFMAHLRDHGVAYTTVAVAGDETAPNGGNIQVNIYDPDGNHIEVQFDRAEAAGADLSAYPGNAEAAAE